MRHFAICLSFLLAMAPVTTAASADELGSLRWKARPVIVFGDAPDAPRVARQLAAFERLSAGLRDRDIRVLQESRAGGALRRRLAIADAGFAVVLVGKDGEVKKVWRDVVEPRQLFALIDAMPMRREEMRTSR